MIINAPFIEGRPNANHLTPSVPVPLFGPLPVASVPLAGLSFTFSYDETANVISYGFTGNTTGARIQVRAYYREYGLWHGHTSALSNLLLGDSTVLVSTAASDSVSYERIPDNGAYGPLVGVIWTADAIEPHPTLGIATADWAPDGYGDPGLPVGRNHIHVLHTLGQVFQATDRKKVIYDDFNRADATLDRSTSNHAWLAWPAILADVVLPGFVRTSDSTAGSFALIRSHLWQAGRNSPVFIGAPTADVDLVTTWGTPPASTVVRSKGNVFHGVLVSVDSNGLPTTSGRSEGDLHLSDVTHLEYVLRSGAWVLNTTPGGGFAGIIFRAEQLDPDVPGMFTSWWARDDRVMYFRKRPDLPRGFHGAMAFDTVDFYYNLSGWTDPTPNTLPAVGSRVRFVPGDRMRVSLLADQVQVFRNGNLVVTVHNTAYQHNTHHGLAGQVGVPAQFDDFWCLYRPIQIVLDAPPPADQADLTARPRTAHLDLE